MRMGYESDGKNFIEKLASEIKDLKRRVEELEKKVK